MKAVWRINYCKSGRQLLSHTHGISSYYILLSLTLCSLVWDWLLVIMYMTTHPQKWKHHKAETEKKVYHKIIPHWRVSYGSAMKWIQKHCVVNLFVYIYRLSLHRSVVHNENMLQNKCLKQTMYASYFNLQPLAVSKMEASRPYTGLPLMGLV